MKSEKTALEHYLRQHIPLSEAMGVRVKSCSSSHIILSAPFENNINHKKTVFGGSLHAVATLACWSLLHVNLSDFEHVQIVIASSEISYLAPVNTDFKAECSMPDRSDWEKFQKTLQRKGKARIKLRATVVQSSKLCVDYHGVFVAVRTIGQ